MEQISTCSYGGPLVEAGALKEAEDHEKEPTLEQGKSVRGAESRCYGLIPTPPSISLHNSGQGK